MKHLKMCPTLGDWDSRRGVEPPCGCERLRLEAKMRSVDLPALTEAIRAHYSQGRHGYSHAACAGAIAAEYAVLDRTPRTEAHFEDCAPPSGLSVPVEHTSPGAPDAPPIPAGCASPRNGGDNPSH